jgi:predicted metal-dependent hydrolase
MAAKLFEVPNIGTIHVYKRRTSKNIRLSISHDGAVRVSLPIWMPYRAALVFVNQKRTWILSNTRKGTLQHDQTIGTSHVLQFVSNNSPDIRTRVNDTHAQVYVPNNLDITDPAVQDAAVRAAKKALRNQAERWLPKRLAALAEMNGYSYKSLNIRHLKTRWGSCNNRKEITLNYYLMQLPDDLIDYVLTHELAHTIELNHSPKFWSIVGSHVPDYKERKKLLRAHQPSILNI